MLDITGPALLRWALENRIMNAFFRILAALAISVCICLGQDQPMNLGELRTNCVAEIERGLFTDLKGIKILDFKLLAWYRIRDSRPWYVDNALCWCKTSTDRGARWVLVHMARNPEPTGSQRRNANLTWHSYFVYDVPNGWLLYFDYPPKNKDVYSRMEWFKFNVEKDWERYDSCIIRDAWEAALGEKPAKQFANQSVQRTGASRSAQARETNRTSSAAGSRR
jgi:hypothetical protein